MAKNRKTPDMNLPVWFDGQNINEALFCEEFLQESRIIFANRAFFTPNGRVTDDIVLRGEVYEKLKSYTISSVPQKIKNIMELLKLEAMVANAKKFNLEHCNNITNSAGRRVWGFMGVEAVARPNINGFYDVSPCTYVPEEWQD